MSVSQYILSSFRLQYLTPLVSLHYLITSSLFWMTGGLSHVILNAPSPAAFDKALSFYCSIGFQIVSDSHDKDESFSGKIAWLAMFSDTENKDLTVKLKMNASMNAKTCVSTDVDYASEDVVLVIATSNLQVT